MEGCIPHFISRRGAKEWKATDTLRIAGGGKVERHIYPDEKSADERGWVVRGEVDSDLVLN